MVELSEIAIPVRHPPEGMSCGGRSEGRFGPIAMAGKPPASVCV
jgi:hypothetical protein